MISFIVPAYNEELLIGRTLAAIHAAAREVGEPYEVIVVDDASTDGTATVAGQGGARVVPVHYRQIGRVRNAGARVATGGIFVFVDADTLITAVTLHATLAVLAAGGRAAARACGSRAIFPGTADCCCCWSARPCGSAGWRRGATCFARGRRSRPPAVSTNGCSRRRNSAQPRARAPGARRHPTRDRRELGAQAAHALGMGILRLMSAVARQGAPALRSRERLELWDGSRRSDPGAGPHEPRATPPTDNDTVTRTTDNTDNSTRARTTDNTDNTDQS